TFNSTNQFFVHLDHTGAPGTGGNNLLKVSGNLDLGTATLTGAFDPNKLPQVGDTFTILRETSSGSSITGQFAGLPENNPSEVEPGAMPPTIVWFGGVKFVVNYFTDHVDLVRQLADITSFTVAPTTTSPVYGQPDTWVVSMTAEAGAPGITGNVVFHVT